MKKIIYLISLLFTVLIQLANVSISIYLLSTTSHSTNVRLVMYTITEFLSCVTIVAYLVYPYQMTLVIITGLMSLFSICCGLTWIQLMILTTTRTAMNADDHKRHVLIIIMFYIIVISTFLKGYILNINQIPHHSTQDLHHDKNERIVTPSSFETIQFHKFINNKDSLQTLVPPHSSSLTNIFKSLSQQQQHDTYPYQISQSPSTDNIQCSIAILQNDQVLQNEKTMLAKISNSLLPPHLQKGESDIIVNRRLSEDMQMELGNIPLIPPQQQHHLFNWNDETSNSNPSISTIPENVKANKKFISLQDWEQNRQNWTTINNNSGKNLNLTILEREEDINSIDELQQGQQQQQQQQQQEHQYEDSEAVILEEEEEKEEKAPSLHSFRHGYNTPPPPLHHKHHHEMDINICHDDEYIEGDDLSIPFDNDGMIDTFDTFNTYNKIHYINTISDTNTNTNTNINSNTRTPSRRLSNSPTRSRSLSKSSSPIKKFFNNHHQQLHNLLHQHSKSMYNLDSSSTSQLQTTTTRKKTSFLNLAHPIISTSSLTIPSSPSSLHQHSQSQYYKEPRRTKSLSPLKRTNILRTPIKLSSKSKHNHFPTDMTTTTTTVTMDTNEEGIFNNAATPDSQFSSGSSPCPSIGFGEYDREKWRRIKLKLEETSSIMT